MTRGSKRPNGGCKDSKAQITKPFIKADRTKSRNDSVHEIYSEKSTDL